MPGTFVMIAEELGPMMAHFENNKPAMIVASYAQEYGGKNVKSYGVKIRESETKWSYCAWYEEHQLSEIKDKLLLSLYKSEILKQRKR